MKKSILIVLGVIVFVGLTVTTVSAKVITVDGVKYQLFQDPDSGEYTLLPLNQPKKAELKKNVLPTSTSESSSPLGSPMDASENNGIIIPFGVISESPDKSEVIEKTESDSVYYEYVCTVPSGCPFKDGKCVGCKKIKVYEEKTVIKLPKEEPEIAHSVLPKKDKFFGIPEGDYHWRHMTTIIGSKIYQKSLAPGFLANYKEVTPGSYLITTSGAAEYTGSSFEGTKVIACPIPSTKFATVDKDGVSEVRKTLVKGTCWDKYPNNTISFRYYNVDANTIRTIWVRKHTTWIVGCEDCADTIRTDISTFVQL